MCPGRIGAIFSKVRAVGLVRGLLGPGCMKALRSYALLTALVAFSPLAHAEPDVAAARALLSSTARPKPSDLRRAYGGTLPATNPFVHHAPAWYRAGAYNDADEGMRHEHLLGHIRETLPKTIAHLEKAHPGATYAALGRDVVQMSDALEAYYSSIGQPHRSVRIDASTASFTGNDKDIVSFVEQTTPLDYAKLHERPFVVYDNTSYGANSQSRKLMRALYGGLHAAGKTSRDHADKLTLTTIYQGYGAPLLPANAARADSALARHVADEQAALGDTGLGPVNILAIPGMGYGLEWHGSFGPMVRTGDVVRTTPTPGGSPQSRESILWEAHEMLKIVESPEFRSAVERESQALGIQAPHHKGVN